MKRKDRDWIVKFEGDAVQVTAKTYSAACRRAFKKMKLQGNGIKKTQPKHDYTTGGFIGVSVDIIPE